MTTMIFEGNTQSYSGADALLSSSLSWGKACKLHASGRPRLDWLMRETNQIFGRLPVWVGPNSVNRQNKSAGRERPALRSVWNLLLGFFCARGLRLGYRPVLLAYLEAGEAPDGDVVTQLADLGRHQLRGRHCLFLDERLIKQAHFLVELRPLAFDDFLDNLRSFASRRSLRAVDFLLALVVLRRDILTADVLRIGCCDVHRDVVQQLFEIVSAGNEVALAIELEQHSDLAASMDIARHRPFICASRSFLASRGYPLLAQNNHRLLDVAVRLGKSILAVANGGAGLVAQLFNHLCVNVHGCSSAHFNYAFCRKSEIRLYK